jgi:hypothetical protein
MMVVLEEINKKKVEMRVRLDQFDNIYGSLRRTWRHVQLQIHKLA